jgi:2,4-dienoyl-CoA reductase-like NADH-dependent reductase (Old Yellow Enzyme family)
MSAMSAHPHFPNLFSPITVGTMRLKNRSMSPPHTSAIGPLFGTDKDAEKTLAYWEVRAKAGLAWMGGVTGRMKNNFIPGFEPSGISAETLGYFRLPFYVERMKWFIRAMRSHGVVTTCQMTMIGGFPHGASPVVSAPIGNSWPHVLNEDEIKAFVEEYGWSAGRAREAGFDGIEMHFNHDDLIEWFLSPLTNKRTDRYGGPLENRARFAVEILTAVRKSVGRDMTLGIRLNADEPMPGGYDAAEGIAIARHFEATGLIDFLHIVVGTPWGNPSYIQPHQFQAGEWSGMAGAIKRAVKLPIVYSGLVNSPAVAERILAAGHADVVGMARAHIADGELLAKAREGRVEDIRPCVGGNDCINRRYVDGLPFGCTVNPHAAQEIAGPWPRTKAPKRLLVIGGGPAGLELAGLAAESGHRVAVWEARDAVGGQVRDALNAPSYRPFGEWLAWQERRLRKLDVDLRLNRRASAADVLADGADVVAVATGVTPRRPLIPGADAPHVLEGRDVLTGRAKAGKRVALIAQDDHMTPLAIADFLSERGHQVTMVYGTDKPAILLGRYSVGAPLGRLDGRGVEIVCLQEPTRILTDGLELRHAYSGRVSRIGSFDSIVLSCHGVSDAALYDELRAKRGGVHVLGDAYAPRRIVFATRQAYALAKLLL